MAIKIYKPTTSGRRGMSVVDYSSLSKKKPEKKLTVPLKKHSGRDKMGRISIRHRGGGSKRKYRIISSLQDKMNASAEVLAIEYDPNRSANIALIVYEDSEKAYILAPDKLKIKDKIIASEKAEIKTANRMKLKNIPGGIYIYDVEITPGQGGKIAKGAGTYAVVMSQQTQEERSNKRLAKYIHVKMPSGEVRLIHGDCFASIGSVSNFEHSAIRIGKAGKIRWLGRRPTVRGKAMNPNSHPHGGGEGVNPIGLKHPKTPWGKPALGYRTRKNKRTNKFIIKRRKK